MVTEFYVSTARLIPHFTPSVGSNALPDPLFCFKFNFLETINLYPVSVVGYRNKTLKNFPLDLTTTIKERRSPKMGKERK